MSTKRQAGSAGVGDDFFVELHGWQGRRHRPAILAGVLHARIKLRLVIDIKFRRAGPGFAGGLLCSNPFLVTGSGPPGGAGGCLRMEFVNGLSLINSAFFEQRHGAAFLFLRECLPQGLATAGSYGLERIGLSEAFHNRLPQTGAAREIIDRSKWAGLAPLFDDPPDLFTEPMEHA